MAMNKKSEQAALEAGQVGAPEGIEPGRAAVIDVSYGDDDTVVAAQLLAIAYPGDEIILLGQAGEVRGFSITLAEDFPLDRSAGGAVPYAKGSPAMALPVSSGSSAAPSGHTLRSGALQTVRLRIDSEAAPGRYDYALEAEITRQKLGVAFAGGVIIRPVPPRPLQ